MSAHSHDVTVPGPPRLEEVSDGIFAYVQPDGTWWINNTGFAVGPQGVVAVDSCSTERRTRAFVDAITSVTSAPVRTLVNTHHHGDHTWGNALFGAATIVAHERARDEMIAFGPPRELPFWDHPEWGSLPLDPPFLTFADGVTLHVGDLRAEVRHVGTAAHTTNDSLVWFPERSTLFCGDLIFNGGTPFLLMGSVVGAIDVLENVVAPLGAATTVPGHGPVFHDRAPLDATLDYLRFVLDVAERGRAAGLTPLQAARDTDLGRFADWPDAERIVGNLHRAYAELDGGGRGVPVDVMAALGDMVTHNGGEAADLPGLSGVSGVAVVVPDGRDDGVGGEVGRDDGVGGEVGRDDGVGGDDVGDVRGSGTEAGQQRGDVGRAVDDLLRRHDRSGPAGRRRAGQDPRQATPAR